MIIFILLIKPYSIKILNYLELANELILLLSCYFMMTFTTWITDVEFQYKIGDVFIKLLSAVFILNSIMIFIEIGSQIKQLFKKTRYEIKWKKYNEEK